MSEKLIKAVKEAQKLQDDRIKHGLNHVDLYINNVEGNWLETWEEPKVTAMGNK